MTTEQIMSPLPTTIAVTTPLVDDFPNLFARLLVQAAALVGDADEAEDVAQETLIAAWQAHNPATPADLDRLVTARCAGWQAQRRALRAALGRLAAGGGPVPSWLTGMTARPLDTETVIEMAMLRVTIGERLGRIRAGVVTRGATTAGGVTDTVPRPPRAALPPVPANLAQTSPVAAALVRAGAPVASVPTTPTATQRRQRPQPVRQTGGATATMTAALARYDRLREQLAQRERAVERTARQLDQARAGYDRAATPAAHVVAEAALATTAVRHERAQAGRRAVARRLADRLATPGLAEALARRERR